MTTKLGVWGMLAALAAGVLAVGPGPAFAQDQKPLRVAMNADPDVLDMTQSTNPPQGLATLTNVYEGLWGFNPDGSKRAGLVVATDVSPDGKTITLHLRKGVKFQSGDPFTSKDVLWSHERMLKKTWFYGGFARFIDHMEAPDDNTVVVKMKQVDAQFLAIPALIIASKTYYDRVGEKEFAAHPAGTGPYKIADYKPGQYLDLATWDGYWDKKPEIQKAHFVFVQDDNTRVAKLQAGEVDLIMATPYASYDKLKADGYTLVKLPVHPTQSVQMSLINKTVPWANVKVRQAMAYAIDKAAIVKGLLHGVPTDYPRLMPDELGYDPNLKDYKYDPAKARQLLNEAGYANGFNMPLYVSTGVYFGTQETAEAVALYLKQNLNINTKMQGIQLIQLLQLIGRMAKDPKGEYVSVAGLPVANLPTPLEGVSLAYYGKAPFALNHDDVMDALYEKADATLDLKQQGELIRQMMAREQEVLQTITLWQYVDVYAMKKGITYRPTTHGLEVVYLPQVHM
ncbi:MAG TPA: ABC transporter substrate-binding protein [Stellaceae bacterium]|nr:ABC transporter substrate-binding protein [Stellaceae bacterium]